MPRIDEEHGRCLIKNEPHECMHESAQAHSLGPRNNSERGKRGEREKRMQA